MAAIVETRLFPAVKPSLAVRASLAARFPLEVLFQLALW